MNRKMITAFTAVALASGACSGTSDQGSGFGEDLANQSSALGTRPTGAILPRLSATPTSSSSTVPKNGDVNPYGVAFVPNGFPSGGLLRAGDIVVANFNNSDNLQGTGTTIVRVNAGASPTLFFSNPATPGLSTALGVLRRGFVLVGNLPSTDGSGVCTEGSNGQEGNVGQGSLQVIDRNGKLVQSLTSKGMLDGPWDLALTDGGDEAHVFVSNALSGTVTRLDLSVGAAGVSVQRETQIASGYAHRCDPAAFVVAPTGLALDPVRDVLYVSSAGDNAIFAVADASDTPLDHGKGAVVVRDATHLHGPLGLVRAQNGDLISAQGDAVNPDANQPSEIVEFAADGRFVAEFSVDSAPGSAFGLALQQFGDGFRFAAVDDGVNQLDVWQVK
jgi:hypothetical protein